MESEVKYGDKTWQIPYPMENSKMRYMVVWIHCPNMGNIRYEVWAHTISLNRTLFIEVYVPGQESEGSCIYVLGYRFCVCIYESWDRISSMVKCMVNILATQCTIVLIRKNIGSIKFISGSAASPDMNFIDPIFSV